MVIDQMDTFEAEGRGKTMAEDAYADALLRYWAAVKEAEGTIAPFFSRGTNFTAEQRDLIADVVAQVAVAEDAYFAALEAADRPVPKQINPSQDD